MKIAIIGSTGAVGLEMLKILEANAFPVSLLKCFSSPRSEGKSLKAFGKNHIVQILKPGCFKDIDLCFFDASDEVSKQWVPHAVESGAWVIDNSSVFRLSSGVPLVVPEVNGDLINDPELKKTKLISGPNCTTVQLVVPLKVLDLEFRLKKVIVSTYQSVSGAGTLAVSELRAQSEEWIEQRPSQSNVLPYVIANNCVPKIGSVGKNGFTSEEMKIMEESKKILGLPDLKITATAARIPIERGHSESVYVECENEINLDQWKSALKKIKNVRWIDDESQLQALFSANGDSIDIGRVRIDPNNKHALLFWVISDNLRKGAALNAFQITERLLKK